MVFSSPSIDSDVNRDVEHMTIPKDDSILVTGPVSLKVTKGSVEVWGHILRPSSPALDIAPAPGFPAIPVNSRKGVSAEVACSPIEGRSEVPIKTDSSFQTPTYAWSNMFGQFPCQVKQLFWYMGSSVESIDSIKLFIVIHSSRCIRGFFF